MDLSTLTDTEINGRLAVALGWTHPCDGRCHLAEEPYDCQMPWGTTNYHAWTPPAFTDAIDALKAGPEKLLREVGWKIAVCELPDGSFEAMWEWNFDDSKRVIAIAPTEARARAEAVCQGLEVSK